MSKEAYSPREVFGPILPLSKNAGYELLRSGRLFSVRCGRKIIIPRSAIEALLRGSSIEPGAGLP